MDPPASSLRSPRAARDGTNVLNFDKGSYRGSSGSLTAQLGCYRISGTGKLLTLGRISIFSTESRFSRIAGKSLSRCLEDANESSLTGPSRRKTHLTKT
jgi:hypothetical protein